MTPSELMRGVEKLGEAPLSVKLLFIANRILSITTEDGRSLRDMSDVRQAAIDCYHAQLALEQEARRPADPAPRDYTCPECGHEHETRDECKKYLGEGKFCPCEAKVTA